MLRGRRSLKKWRMLWSIWEKTKLYNIFERYFELDVLIEEF